MPKTERHGLSKYNAGCRCDQCKQVMSEYRKAHRRKISEAMGDVAAPPATGLRLLRVSENSVSTSENANQELSEPQQTPDNSVLAAVRAEIESIGAHPRPGLAAAALVLAADLGNSKAVSVHPAAAAKLSDLLEQLRKSASGKRSKLASVRAMTIDPNGKATG